jgi:uncharacterized membrane protein
MKEKIKIIVAVLIIGLICFGAGYSVGIFQTANFMAKKAVDYLNTYQHINITIDDVYKYFGRFMK